MTFLLRGRRSIWCGCKVMPVAPRIVNDVSYVMRIICDADQASHSFCVAGAVFGEVGGRVLSLCAL